MDLKKFFQMHNLPLAHKKLVVASSGGPDSMALTHLLIELKKDVQFDLFVAHFDHQLRQDSMKESDLLQAYCQSQNLPLIEGRWQHGQITSGLESRARAARYDFLKRVIDQVQGDYLLTAHHNDDLLENILIKLIRSGNPAEMNSLQAVSNWQGVKLLRPLLAFVKDDLLMYDRQHHLPYIEDETNKEDDILRNRLRHHVLPLLKKENPLLADNVLRFSQQMNLLTDLAKKQIDHLPLSQPFLGSFRIKEDALANLLPNEKSYYWQRQVWYYRKRHIGFDLRGWQLYSYQGYEYLLAGGQNLSQEKAMVKLNEKFEFCNEQFVLTSEIMEEELVDSFYAEGECFWVASLPSGSKLPLKNGQHAKAKKMFARAAIPLQLRNRCLSVFDEDDQVLFVQYAYRNQRITAASRKIYLYRIFS